MISITTVWIFAATYIILDAATAWQKLRKEEDVSFTNRDALAKDVALVKRAIIAKYAHSSFITLMFSIGLTIVSFF